LEDIKVILLVKRSIKTNIVKFINFLYYFKIAAANNKKYLFYNLFNINIVVYSKIVIVRTIKKKKKQLLDLLQKATIEIIFFFFPGKACFPANFPLNVIMYDKNILL
jgi:hypothetical protein